MSESWPFLGQRSTRLKVFRSRTSCVQQRLRLTVMHPDSGQWVEDEPGNGESADGSFSQNAGFSRRWEKKRLEILQTELPALFLLAILWRDRLAWMRCSGIVSEAIESMAIPAAELCHYDWLTAVCATSSPAMFMFLSTARLQPRGS